jgi:hypothetical protein
VSQPQDSSNFDPGAGTKAKLASLDGDFNTNPQFGFLGMLEAHEQKEKEANEAFKKDRNPAQKDAVDQEEKKSPSDPPDWLAPINTSVQVMKGEMSQRLSQLANEISSIKSPPAATPINRYEDVPEEVRPVFERMDAQQRAINEVALRTEHNRAREALRSAKARYKDFAFEDQSLDEVWRNHAKGNPDRVANVNWDLYFDQQYHAQLNPKLSAENKELREKLESLQSNRNSVQDLQAVPRTNRQSTPAMSSKTDDAGFNEELYQRAKSKIQKGRFVGFGRALIEEQQRMLRNSA